MFYRIRSFRAIVRTTFIEAIQEPAALLVLLTAVCVTSIAPLFHFHAFGEEGRLARDGGLASLLVFGLALEAAKSLGQSLEQNAIIWCGADCVPDLILLK